MSNNGGPQSWKEMKDGIKRRKDTVRRRNQQIDSLKSEIDRLREQNRKLREALRKISDVSLFDHPKSQIIGSEEYEGVWLDCVDIANGALSESEETK